MFFLSLLMCGCRFDGFMVA
uniref:Uncharacterized protein n=1 Tax=Arundo donax TaxID=35708 RepID=A0A0A8Z443_ARUDO